MIAQACGCLEIQGKRLSVSAYVGFEYGYGCEGAEREKGPGSQITGGTHIGCR
jgi:hypothetical protein